MIHAGQASRSAACDAKTPISNPKGRTEHAPWHERFPRVNETQTKRSSRWWSSRSLCIFIYCAICPTSVTWLLRVRVRVIPQHIDMLLFACDLADRLDERGLAKVKCALTLQAISRQVLPSPRLMNSSISPRQHTPSSLSGNTVLRACKSIFQSLQINIDSEKFLEEKRK